MSVFVPDDKNSLVNQLNQLNNSTVPETDLEVVLQDGKQIVRGIGEHSGRVEVTYPKRDFNILFPQGAILKVANLSNVTGRQALEQVNDEFKLAFPESYFETAGLDETCSGLPSYQFGLVAKADNPFWTGTLYISCYTSRNTQADNATVLNEYPDLYSQTMFRLHLNVSQVTGTCVISPPFNGARGNWFGAIRLSVSPTLDGTVQIDWRKYKQVVPVMPMNPTLVAGQYEYFTVFTFDKGKTWYVKQLTQTEFETDVLGVILQWSQSVGPVDFMAIRHDEFLTRNTGAVSDPKTDHVVFNEANVLVNNRHFTYETRQEGQPDGDATTEGQALFILGAAIYGDASGDTAWRDRAIVAYTAYINTFYAGLLPPTLPARWISNWIANGKAPVLAHYPLAQNDFPTHGGFHATEVTFVNGVGQLPHGTPTFGEHTDLVTQVYEGVLGWPNLTATVYVLNPDGSTDWSTKGVVYPVEKIGLRTLKFADGDGNLIGDCTEPERGQIVLVDKSVNKTLKVAWAPRVPVADGGYLIATNECQHNRPIQVPVTRDYMGNASDAEQWFCEGAWSLWQLTGEAGYRQAFEASRFTINEYTEIDANDKFFRQVIGTDRYDTDGISYFYTYPSSTPVVIDRDEQGYIRTRSEVAVQTYFEQKALNFRVNRLSRLRLTYGGQDDAGNPVNYSASLTLSIDKSEVLGKEYRIDLPASATVTSLDMPIGSLIPADLVDVAADPQSGTPGAGIAAYEIPMVNNIDWSDACTNTNQQETNVLDGRTATTFLSTATGPDQQVDIKLKQQAPINSIVYKSNIDYNIRVADANGWRFWAMLAASTNWTTVDLSNPALWSLSGYQPDGTGEEPSAYVPGAGPLLYSILPDDASVANDYIRIYCVNDLPPADAEQPGTAVEDPVSGSVQVHLNTVTWSEANVASMAFASDLPDGRSGVVLVCTASGTGQQVELTAGASQVVRQLIYKADIDYNVRIEDAEGWRWRALLPASPTWKTQRILIGDWSLSSYQPNHDDAEPRPSAPNFGAGTTDIVLLPDSDSAVGNSITLYCINLPPATYSVDDGYTILFTIKGTMEGAGTMLIGDCTILDQRQDALPYTPGLIPFSNNYVPNAPTFDGWHGQPYPGYQHPWVFLDLDRADRDLMIQNVVQFWVDSQEWYHTKFGIYGPGASAYVWDRWDAPTGATVNDFTMYHFGDQEAWSGYQPRAFFSAVRLYAGLKERNRALPTGLETYISRWLDYLHQFLLDSDGVSPTEFPMGSVPVAVPDDFTGHMAGLWLAGAALAALHQFPNDNAYPVARMVYEEIRSQMINNYTVADVMNGGWSPWSDPNNLGKDGMFFGFWSGEILRGLGYYRALVLQNKPTMVVGQEYKLGTVLAGFSANYTPTAYADNFTVLSLAVDFVIPDALMTLLGTVGATLDAAEANPALDALLNNVVNHYGASTNMTLANLKAAFGKRQVLTTDIAVGKQTYQCAVLGAVSGQTETLWKGPFIVGVNKY